MQEHPHQCFALVIVVGTAVGCDKSTSSAAAGGWFVQWFIQGSQADVVLICN